MLDDLVGIGSSDERFGRSFSGSEAGGRGAIGGVAVVGAIAEAVGGIGATVIGVGKIEPVADDL